MEQNKYKSRAAVRGQAVAGCALRPKKFILDDNGIGYDQIAVIGKRYCVEPHIVSGIINAAVEATPLPVSARAADASSEPTFVWIAGSKTFSQVFVSEEAARAFVSHLPPSVSGGISITKSVVIGKSRAADALDSQLAAACADPEEPSERESLIACMGDDAATLLRANPDDEMAHTMREAAAMLENDGKALDSQPTVLPAECSDEMYHATTHICNLLEREDVNAMWRAMREVVLASSQPTDGGVRNG